MKSILTNTVKITVTAVLAILCAKALKLDFAVSAGIVAILSVQSTKKETLRTALARLLAFSVAQMDFCHGYGFCFDFALSFLWENRPCRNQK